MVYSSVFRVKSLVTTDKSDSEIIQIIGDADQFIDMYLGGTSAPAALKASWSSRMAAYLIQSMATSGGITGSSTANISTIKIGDAEIRKENSSGGGGSVAGKTGNSDWRSQVQEEIRSYIRGSKRG